MRDRFKTDERPYYGVKRQVLRFSPRPHMFSLPAVNFHPKVFPSSEKTRDLPSCNPLVGYHLTLRISSSSSRVPKSLFNHDEQLPLSLGTAHFEITFLASCFLVVTARVFAECRALVILRRFKASNEKRETRGIVIFCFGLVLGKQVDKPRKKQQRFC